jgi:hypothetical protein
MLGLSSDPGRRLLPPTYLQNNPTADIGIMACELMPAIASTEKNADNEA